jgi:hypothetical protein
MTIITHLYGAPGAGKSTAAACLFSKLKKHGVNAELVTECAKDWVWGNRKIDRYGQTFLTAKQMLKETALLDKVDVIVTDSPFPLGGFYYFLKYKDDKYEKFLLSLLQDIEDSGHSFVSIFIPKSSIHEEKGRIHNRKESMEIEISLKVWLFNNNIDVKSVLEKDENFVFDQVMRELLRGDK